MVVVHCLRYSSTAPSQSLCQVCQRIGAAVVEQHGSFRYPQRCKFGLERAVEVGRLALGPALVM